MPRLLCRRRQLAAIALPALLAGGDRARAAGGGGAVTLLVGAAPGSAADAWARGFAPFLERHRPRSAVAVRNLPGEGGLAAARRLAAAPPEEDGPLLLGAVATPGLLARAIESGERALLARLLFLAAVSEDPLVLVGHPGSAESLAGLRALGPEAVTLGTPPPGSAAQLAALELRRALPFLRLLPFPSAAAARQAVLAGHIPCALVAAPEAIAALGDGRLAGLAIAAAERSPLLPELPTFAEAGLSPAMPARRGFALPAGHADKGRQALEESLRAAVADPEFADQARAAGSVPRFLDRATWEPEIRRSIELLARRWAEDPWVMHKK